MSRTFKIKITNNRNDETVTYVTSNQIFIENAIKKVMEDLTDNYASFLSSSDTVSISSELVHENDLSEIRYIS